MAQAGIFDLGASGIGLNPLTWLIEPSNLPELTTALTPL
jgi:hypothetical protein